MTSPGDARRAFDLPDLLPLEQLAEQTDKFANALQMVIIMLGVTQEHVHDAHRLLEARMTGRLGEVSRR